MAMAGKVNNSNNAKVYAYNIEVLSLALPFNIKYLSYFAYTSLLINVYSQRCFFAASCKTIKGLKWANFAHFIPNQL